MGSRPGPAGYSIADLRCVPTVQRHAQGVYTESAVALVLSGIFEHLSDSSACMAVPGSLVFANKRAEFSCRHQGLEGNRRIVVFFSEAIARTARDRSESRHAEVSGGVGAAFAPDAAGRRPVADDRARFARQR